MQRAKVPGNPSVIRHGVNVNKPETLSWTPQGYIQPNASVSANAYSISNYYGPSYHYPTYCVGDGPTQWPTSEPITYVSNYNGLAPETAAVTYSIDPVYAPNVYNPYPTATPVNPASFNYYTGTPAEYAAWSAVGSYPPEYYHNTNVYNGVDATASVTHNLQTLNITAKAPPTPYGNMVRKDISPAAEKKITTWASIAQKPVKLTPQNTSVGPKKKGPGMPPPPVVLGRHNIDLEPWEEKSIPGPINVPPVVQAPPLLPSTLSETPVWTGPELLPRKDSAVSTETTFSAAVQFEVAKSPVLPPPLPDLLLPAESISQSTSTPKSQPVDIPAPDAGSSLNTTVSSSSSPPKFQESYGSSSSSASKYQPTPSSPSDSSRTSLHPSQPITLSPLPPSPSTIKRSCSSSSHAVVDKLKDPSSNYNPVELEIPPRGTRFFVIKSYSEDDVHRSIKYEIWCSTEHGNKRLDDAFRSQKSSSGSVYLFFSVNGSGHFCGVAKMVSPVDYGASSSVWAQDKWKGQFKVCWIYVKDVPNAQLRHIRIENNENKPVTNSRDTTEVPYDKGVDVLSIIHSYSHVTSIFDDFTHYEKRQEEGDSSRRGTPVYQLPPTQYHHGRSGSSNGYRNPFPGRNMYRDRDTSNNNLYSNSNFNRRGDRGDRTHNGASFAAFRNHSNPLRS